MPGRALLIATPIVQELIAHARELAPFECCGLLAGKAGRVLRQYRVTNTVATEQQAVAVFDQASVKRLGELPERLRAEVAYFMDPKEMVHAFKEMRSQRLDLVGIYHSHPHSPAYPSATDVGLAYYPEAAYVIISLQQPSKPNIRAYWIKEQTVTPCAIEVTDEPAGR